MKILTQRRARRERRGGRGIKRRTGSPRRGNTKEGIARLVALLIQVAPPARAAVAAILLHHLPLLLAVRRRRRRLRLLSLHPLMFLLTSTFRFA
jgi:hypothetical protein